MELYEQKLAELKEKIPLFLENFEWQHHYHLRIIFDKKIEFPDYYTMVGHDRLIEVTNTPWNQHPNKGWSKPDIQHLGIEIHYLWKKQVLHRIN